MKKIVKIEYGRKNPMEKFDINTRLVIDHIIKHTSVEIYFIKELEGMKNRIS